MSKKCWLLPGRTYSFQYPRYNYNGIPSKLEDRLARVKSVRDTKSDAIVDETKDSNPMLRRGRWLVVCEDIEKGAERSFYFESMGELQEVMSDPNPLIGMEYCIVDHRRMVFASESLSDVSVFQSRIGRGILCSVVVDHAKDKAS